MSAHTPGPWTIKTHLDRAYIKGTEAGALVRSTVAISDNGNEADANLIAAAPDLLAALERAETYIATHGGVGFNEPLKSIRAAIAKAKGAA